MIQARTSEQLSQAEIQTANKFVVDNPALEDSEHNANELFDYIVKQWKVLITEESLKTAYKNLSEAGRLKIKSDAQLKFEQVAAQGYTAEQQNILSAWLKSRHLVNTPGTDEAFENSAAVLGAMRGRTFDYHNLDFCLTYLQSKGQKLHWEQRPGQNLPRTRGHIATSPADYRFAPKEASNLPGPGLVSHSSNPKFNGTEERLKREASRPVNPEDEIMSVFWKDKIALAVAEGRTHSERARIAQAARQAAGGLREQAKAAAQEAARLRKEREMGR